MSWLAGCYLYRYYNDQGRLIYVGISIDPERRMKEHRGMHRQIADVSIEAFPDRRSALAAELEAIRTEWPLYNDHGNPDKSLVTQSREDAYRHACAELERLRAGIPSPWERRARLHGAAKAAVERKREKEFREELAHYFRVWRLVRKAMTCG